MVDVDELFELTAAQKRAFNRLKKAYLDCEKAGVLFYNCYGNLGAVDSKKINEYTDIRQEGAVMNTGQNILNELRIPNEWTDDTHYFIPAKGKGK